jgi:hypothetical protein
MAEVLNEPTSRAGLAGGALDVLTYDEKIHSDSTHLETAEDKAGGPGGEMGQDDHLIRSVWEETPYRTTLKLFWKGALVCFLAAFSSFTDGYQVGLR